ncbi:MAG: SRPBCC family protein [Pseudoxanthomonas sp.]
MKLLKWLLWTMVALAVLVGGGGLLCPATSHLERSTVIERPPAEVFATLDSFRRFNEWSPWFEMDPTAKYTYSGPASGVGARMAWAGSSSVGSGSQEILESVPHSRIVNALDFGGSQATATFTLAPESNGTRVTWSFDSEHGYNPINRLFGALLLERLVGTDYEKGLAKLKAHLEAGVR